MLNSIHDQHTGPRVNDLYQQDERKTTESRPAFVSSVLSEKEDLVDEDGELAMFGSFLVDGHDGDACHKADLFVPATPPFHGSSPFSAFTSPRPSSSSSSSSTSLLGYSPYPSFASFNYLRSAIPEHEEASSSWASTSPTSPDFSMTRKDSFGLGSLHSFGRVQDHHGAGGFEQHQQLDRTDEWLEADRLQWAEKNKALEDEDATQRAEEIQPQEAQLPFTSATLSTTTSLTPTVFAPPLTSDHTNPYHELGRYHLRCKSPLPSSSSASPTLLVLNPSPRVPLRPQSNSRSLPLSRHKLHSSIFSSTAPAPRPRSSSFGVKPTFVKHPLASTSLSPTQEEVEEDFETALARLRREKGEMKIGFPRLRWLDEGVGE